MFQVPRETCRNGNPKGKQTYQFPSFQDATVDLRSLPLSYQFENLGQVQPDPEALCDLPSCRSISRDGIKRMACFHTLHETCMSLSGCPICKAPLQRKAEELSNSFNKGLLDGSDQNNTSDDSSDEDEDDEQNLPNTTNSSDYYTSQEWQTKITNITNDYHPVRQPTNSNRVQSLLQPARRLPQTFQDQQSSVSTEERPQVLIPQLPTLNILIAPTICNDFTTWHFPQHLSQSSIQGRSGSNACTLISLTIAKLFHTFPIQSVDPKQHLNTTLAYLVVSGMLIGNQNYDNLTKGVPQYFSVREGVASLSFLGNVTVGNEMAVSIIDEQVPTASLLHHLDSALTCNTTTKSAYLFILDGRTVSFIPMPHSQILLVDSHLHGNTGALVAYSQRGDLPQLLSWFKAFNAFQYTLGTVTKITFN